MNTGVKSWTYLASDWVALGQPKNCQLPLKWPSMSKAMPVEHLMSTTHDGLQHVLQLSFSAFYAYLQECSSSNDDEHNRKANKKQCDR